MKPGVVVVTLSMARLTKGHPVAHLVSKFWVLGEWLDVMCR